MKKMFDKIGPYTYSVGRIIFGLLFFAHGLMKPFSGLMAVASVIEVVVGISLILGLFTRYSALLGAVEMLFAYFIKHLPNGWNPVGQTGNGGELALLFFCAFLMMIYCGSGKVSIDHLMQKQ